MPWKGLDIVEILQIGVIGLGFLLALLAYHLLTKEQKQKVPRTNILRSIYVFMFFSIALCLIGVFSQARTFYTPNRQNGPSTQPDKISKSKELQTLHIDLNSANNSLRDAKEQLNQLRGEYDKIATEKEEFLGANKQLTIINQQLIDSERKVTELQQQIDKVQEQNKLALHKLSKTQKELKNCQVEFGNQKAEFDQVLAKLKSVQATQSPESKTGLDFPADPFWLELDKVVRLADGFVFLMYDYYSYNFRLVLTVGTQQDKLLITSAGQRFEFNYKNQKYFIDVLEKVDRKISVVVTSAN